MLVVTKEGSDGKGCGEKVEAHVRGDEGMVEGNKDSWRQAMMHETFTLPTKGGEFMIFGMVSRG